MRFANPEAFLLMLLLPVALWWSLRPRQRAAAQFSAIGMAGKAPAGWAVWGPTLLALLRVTALALLIVALARPQTAGAAVRGHSEGITVQLVIDNSYSMKTLDYDLGSYTVSRLDAVKHAVRLFVQGGEHGLRGRPDDKIGLITFARDPDVVCPATLDHQALLQALERIQLAPPVGTNIGDALAWALDRLRHDPAKGKVIVLLSDGSHNVKDGLQPLEAAKLAADLKVKVYTIGAVGNRFGKASPPAPPAGGNRRTAEDSVDEPTMRRIAEATGGRYFRATDVDGLVSIYEEIDRLETTRMETPARVAYREWFLVLMIPAIVALAAEQSLTATRLLRIP
jgi:Ca-activated chloride channel family protein